jgi:hypothetical protein
MNKNIFKYNLEKAITELKAHYGEEIKEYFFMINPVLERGKSLSSTDDVMRLNILSDKNIGGKEFTLDEVVALLTFYAPLVPIWIDVRLKEIRENIMLFQLDCSLRFRKPSLLHNQETGYVPFRVLI